MCKLLSYNKHIDSQAYIPNSVTSHMLPFVLVLPLLPGKEKGFDAFVRAIGKSRRKDFAGSNERFAVSKEAWFLQRSPSGNSIIIYFECPDPSEALRAFKSSRYKYDIWLREQLKVLSGVDLSRYSAESSPRTIMSYGYRKKELELGSENGKVM